MQFVPNIRLENSGASLKVVYIDNSDLALNKRSSYLSEDIFALATTFRVQSLVGFENATTSSGQIVMIGDPRMEKTEIRRTTNNQYPSESYKEVILQDALKFDHPQDTKVYIINWDRVEVDYSTTATGTKTTIAAYPVAIQPDTDFTYFRDTTEPTNRLGQATVFYFARFNSSLDNRFSDYSDPAYGTGFDANMVGAIKRRALEDLGEVVDGSLITQEFLNESLWEARRAYHNSTGKRPFRRKFNAVLGTALTGSYRIELPTDTETPYGAENVYGVRIGPNANMLYYDKKEFDYDYRNKPHTYLLNAYVRGARDLYVNSARDLADVGAVSIEGTSISYSAKSNSGGTLRISTDGSWNCSAGSDVWQNITYGLPSKFTVWADPGGSAYIYFNMPIDTAYIGMNIFGDYYSTLLGYDSDADVLDEPQYDMYVDYLKYKITERKLKGAIPVIRNRQGGAPIIADANFQSWINKKSDSLQGEFNEQNIRMAPDINNLDIPY